MSSGRKPREEKDIFKRPSLRQFQIAGDISFECPDNFPIVMFSYFINR